MSARTDLYRLYVLVFVSCAMSLLLAVYPVNPAYKGLRPEVVCLMVIFWITSVPQHFGVLFAWSIGLWQDIVEGVVWGAHATSLGIMAYVCLVAYQRIKNFSIWHQTIWIFVLVGFHQVIVNWVQGLAGYKAQPLDLILSSIVSALCWPLLFVSITRIQAKYRL